MPDARLTAKLKEEAFRAAAAARGEAPEPLFKAKMSKEEKKAAAEAKRAELAAKKAARKAADGSGAADEAEDGGSDAAPADADESVAQLEEAEAAEVADGSVGVGKPVGGAARRSAKAAMAAKAAEVESITAGAAVVSLSDGQELVAASRAVTGVLASAPKAWDVKFTSFSLAVGGNQLVADCDLELTQASFRPPPAVSFCSRPYNSVSGRASALPQRYPPSLGPTIAHPGELPAPGCPLLPQRYSPPLPIPERDSPPCGIQLAGARQGRLAFADVNRFGNIRHRWTPPTHPMRLWYPA
eukprot:scaffold1926_cov122-Isochrysis_galbana.AAC.12